MNHKIFNPQSSFFIRLSTLFILISLGFSSMYAQVLTRYLTPDQTTEEIIPFPLDENIPYYMQPDVDFDEILEQDQQEGRSIPRFAVCVGQHYTVQEGYWTQIGSQIVWQVGFSAPKASSLNFLISDLTLPDGSQMFIASKDGRMIHGPIVPEVIYDQKYASDIIGSSDVQIIVKCHSDLFEQFSILIASVCQGVPKPIESRDWQDAADCHFDVNCSVGNGWEDERDAVALILKNGEGWCSGALVNNQCLDLTPNFLTAFHCIDSDEDGELSSLEKNLSNYAFRFKYEASDTMCPGNSTGTQGTWIVYSGAMFRSANNATDFALVELNGNLVNKPNITLAGWDRRNIAPLSTTIIHHPEGDAKKITFENDSASQTTFLGAQCWWLQVDLGATEGGSSGSPYFNPDHRIIGQHYGVNDAGLPICNRVNKFGGRFDLSWTGGGSDTTRLSNWLGGTNPPDTMNTIRVPSVNAMSNSGNLICTTNKQFTLDNPIPGRTVTWQVNNTFLFATTMGASTSGIGTTATLRAASGSVSGSAILTFILTLPGCDTVIVNHEIWVGLPDFGLNYDDHICFGDQEIASLELFGPYSTSLGSIEWNFSGSIVGVGSTVIARYRGVSSGWGSICVKATNACGETTKCYWVYVDECLHGDNNEDGQEFISHGNKQLLKLEVSPNPTSDILAFDVKKADKNVDATITICDIRGKVLLKQTVSEGSFRQDMSACQPGLYFVQLSNGAQVITKKISKL